MRVRARWSDATEALNPGVSRRIASHCRIVTQRRGMGGGWKGRGGEGRCYNTSTYQFLYWPGPSDGLAELSDMYCKGTPRSTQKALYRITCSNNAEVTCLLTRPDPLVLWMTILSLRVRMPFGLHDAIFGISSFWVTFRFMILAFRVLGLDTFVREALAKGAVCNEMFAVVRNDVIASYHSWIIQSGICLSRDLFRFEGLPGRHVVDSGQRLRPGTELCQRNSSQLVRRELDDLVVSHINHDVTTQGVIAVYGHSVTGQENTETKPKRNVNALKYLRFYY